MTSPIAIFLCDESGVMAEPWAEAGIECFCVDLEHSIRRDRKVGLINFVWGDCRTWIPPARRKIIFGGAFPPCTHTANSGARDFAKKRGMLLRDALETYEACWLALGWSGAPFFVEQPRGIFSSIPHIGRPHFEFDPADYSYLADDPASETYSKATCLRVGGGFVMPDKKRIEPVLFSKMHLLPPSDDRQAERSRTPQGFSRAVFQANHFNAIRIAA
jgi:hypothetical protein